MRALLPEKYYLHHARELFAHLQRHCSHLLDDDGRRYLALFTGLDEDAQCLVVRCLARKPKYLKEDSLHYPEIIDTRYALRQSIEVGLLSRPLARDWPALTCALTKADLIKLLRHQQSHAPISSDTRKDALVALAQTHLSARQVVAVLPKLVVRRQTHTVDYLFFLFFGHLNNQFQKFVMRDLGVLTTRKSKSIKARFATLEEARSCFHLHRLFRLAKHCNAQQLDSICHQALASKPYGAAAVECRDNLFLLLGEKHAVSEDKDAQCKAIELWRQSKHPDALERRIRLAYKLGAGEALKQELKALQNETLAPRAQLFVLDFYQRKFQSKRTSLCTDVLRQSTRTLYLDELFISNAERGAIEQYQQQGVTVFFSENQFWRALFGLSLWPILWGDDHCQHTEFDRLPARLTEPDFYQRFKCDIEAQLSLYKNPSRLTKVLTQRATQFYGHANGVFRWRADLLDILHRVLKCPQAPALATVLRDIARHYLYAKDGYPDLLVISNNAFHFEEIKAPGDQLRPNQLVALNRLRKAGINAEITQVKWSINPQQAYAVVDIETTGGRRGGHGITEIAVVTVRNGQVEREWSTLLNPGRPIPKHITRLTGIDNAMVASAPRFSEIADRLYAELNGSIFIAHNVGFDYGFIQSAYENLGRRFKRPRGCTVRMARKTFPGLKSYSLASLTEHLNIDLTSHHRALNDARATADLLCLIHGNH